MESVAVLTKEIGILTPLVLSIVVWVAPRLISYKQDRNQPQDRIIHVKTVRSYRTREEHQIILYMGFGVGNKKRKRCSPMYLRMSEVQT